MSTQFDREFDELAHTEDAYLYGDAESENEVSEINSPAVGITEEMIADGVQALTESSGEVYSVQVPDRVAAEQLVRQVLGAALAGRTVVDLDWAVVEAAVHRAVIDWARAYWIPANGLCGGDRDRERKMASAWADGSAPHITACIREDLRKAASGSSKGGDPRE